VLAGNGHDAANPAEGVARPSVINRLQRPVALVGPEPHQCRQRVRIPARDCACHFRPSSLNPPGVSGLMLRLVPRGLGGERQVDAVVLTGEQVRMNLLHRLPVRLWAELSRVHQVRVQPRALPEVRSPVPSGRPGPWRSPERVGLLERRQGAVILVGRRRRRSSLEDLGRFVVPPRPSDSTCLTPRARASHGPDAVGEVGEDPAASRARIGQTPRARHPHQQTARHRFPVPPAGQQLPAGPVNYGHVARIVTGGGVALGGLAECGRPAADVRSVSFGRAPTRRVAGVEQRWRRAGCSSAIRRVTAAATRHRFSLVVAGSVIRPLYPQP
jgi:hypothetical protein